MLFWLLGDEYDAIAFDNEIIADGIVTAAVNDKRVIFAAVECL
jgi:hypothetical protein